MPLDLTTAALGNAEVHRDNARRVIQNDQSGVVSRLFELAASAEAATNVDAFKVVEYDRARRVLDARSYFVAKCGDAQLGADEFDAAQGPWLVRRQAFEDLWTHGRSLVYAALSVGGMGTEGRYGPFCLVLDVEREKPEALALFPGNTAERYTDATGRLDEALAQGEVVGWPERAHVVVIERAEEATGQPEDRWPEVVCRPDRFIEVVLGPRVPLAAVNEARVRADFRQGLAELWARSLSDDALSGVENALVSAYVVLLRWRRAGIGLVEVA